MTWRVPYIDLGAQYRALKEPLDAAISRVMASGRYINGEETERFEEAMAEYLGVEHVVSCGNGYDALYMALKILGVEKFDESIAIHTDDYTHVSTHAAIVNAGGEISNEYAAKIYIPVHMNGRVNFPRKLPTPRNWRLEIIEDACQAIGAEYEGNKAGTIGVMGCFSLHPMKVLGCAGDGGFIATDRGDHAHRLRNMRNHGQGKGYGVNSRLDNLQAAILNVKLPYLEDFIARRREIAARYEKELPEWVQKPPAPSDGPYFDTYSSYVIGGSPELLAHLRAQGIECFSHIRTDVVSLPIYPEMPDSHIEQVCEAVRSYFNG